MWLSKKQTTDVCPLCDLLLRPYMLPKGSQPWSYVSQWPFLCVIPWVEPKWRSWYKQIETKFQNYHHIVFSARCRNPILPVPTAHPSHGTIHVHRIAYLLMSRCTPVSPAGVGARSWYYTTCSPLMYSLILSAFRVCQDTHKQILACCFAKSRRFIGFLPLRWGMRRERNIRTS